MEIAAEVVDVREVCPATEDPAAEELANLPRPAVTRVAVLIQEVPVEHLEEVMSPEAIMEGTTIPEDIMEVTTGTITGDVAPRERASVFSLAGPLLEGLKHGGLITP